MATSNLCPICGEREFVPFRKGNLVRCRSCGLVVDPGIWKPGADAARQEEWFGQGFDVGDSPWVRLFEGLNNRRTWSRIAPFLTQGSRLLEVGVGSGSFLEFARRRGVEVAGCDLSQAVCEEVQRRRGILVFNASVADLPKSASYDVVVMNHVLEHSSEPRRLLQQVRSRMAESGVLHLVVPNVGCWEAALPGWNCYEPYHLSYFTPGTLLKALERAGFDPVRVATHDSFSGWYLAVLRTLLPARLHDPGRRRAARAARAGSWLEHPYRIAMVVAGWVTLPLRYVQARLGYGDEVVVLARPHSNGKSTP